MTTTADAFRVTDTAEQGTTTTPPSGRTRARHMAKARLDSTRAVERFTPPRSGTHVLPTTLYPEKGGPGRSYRPFRTPLTSRLHGRPASLARMGGTPSTLIPRFPAVCLIFVPDYAASSLLCDSTTPLQPACDVLRQTHPDSTPLPTDFHSPAEFPRTRVQTTV